MLETQTSQKVNMYSDSLAFLHISRDVNVNLEGKWIMTKMFMFISILQESKYRISRPIRRTFFFPKKCGLSSTCILCAEGKCYFQTYKYPYPQWVKTTMKMAVMTVFWISMMNELYYGC